MIVIDTNVVLASLISSKGYSFKLVELVLEGQVDYLVNASLLYEYQSVVARPENLRRIPLSFSEIETFLALIVQNSTHADVHFKWRPNLKDENDNFIVELAIAGKAESIVTFNKGDFLQAELKFDLKIETPKEFFKRRN